MKEVNVIAYQAWDGAQFATAAQCRDHEDKSLDQRLALVTVKQVQAALDGSDPDLGDAYERFAKLVRDARRKRGESRWPAARHKTPPAAADEPVAEEAAAEETAAA